MAGVIVPCSTMFDIGIQKILNNIKCSYLKYMSGSYLFTNSEISSKISSETRGEEIVVHCIQLVDLLPGTYHYNNIKYMEIAQSIQTYHMVMIFSKYESSIYMEIALIIEIGNIEMRQNIVWILVGMFYRILIQ